MILFHNEHTISINRCNQMLITKDSSLLAKVPMLKMLCEKKYIEFIDVINQMFNEEQIKKHIDDTLIRSSFTNKINALKIMYEGFDCVLKFDLEAEYDTKEARQQKADVIRQKDALGKYYYDHFFAYPTKDVLKVIENEIKKLDIKKRMFEPKQEGQKKESKGLEHIISFVQTFNPEMGYLDRAAPLISLEIPYKNAMKKAEDMKNAK